MTNKYVILDLMIVIGYIIIALDAFAAGQLLSLTIGFVMGALMVFWLTARQIISPKMRFVENK